MRTDTAQAAIVQHGAEQLDNALPAGYADWLADVKKRVRVTQFRAARAANVEVINLYWSIGKDIRDRQDSAGWGAKVVDRIAADMSREFPGQTGWSATNLKYMRRFADAWPEPDSIWPQVVAKLPWGHVRTLIDRLNSRDDRDWYAARAVAEGWKRNVLEHFIKVGLRQQLGSAKTNFAATLDDPNTELAQQLIKDPYVFEHLAYVERVDERNVEQALMDRLQDTLTEFGRGTAFVGRQVRLEVRDETGDVEEVVLDLLLFHIPQRRYIVVELKIDRFKPAYVGQLGTYVAIVDDQLRDPEHNAPTVGVLLCTGKNEAIVRFALASSNAPLGVAGYEGLPKDAQAALPRAEELEAVLQDELARHNTTTT